MDRKSFLPVLNDLTIGIIIAILFLFPLLFFTAITDAYVVPKQLLVIISTILLLIVWVIRSVVVGRVSFLSNQFNLAFFLFGVAILCSAFLSQNRYDSLIQAVPVVVLLLFSFLVANLIDKKEYLGRALFALTFGGVISSLISILYFMKIYILPFSNPNNPLFTTFGSPIQHIAYILPLFFLSSVYAYRKMQKDGIERKALSTKTLTQFLFSFILLLGIGLNIYKIYFAQDRPVVLPVQYGIQIATASLGQDMQRQLPALLFGSGFGTFLTDFTRFKPITFNLEPQIWSLNIGFSSSLVLELIATIGIAGTLAFIYIILRFFRTPNTVKSRSLYVSIVVSVLLTVIIPYSFTFIFLLFVLLSCFISLLHIEKNKQVYPVSLSLVRPQNGLISFDSHPDKKSDSHALPIVLGILLLIPLSVIGFYSVRYIQSDVNFKKAQDPEQLKNGQQAYDLLREAIEIFPYRDEYFRLFSQVNLSLANSMTTSLKPNEQPTPEVQQTIFSLLQQTINSARSAVVLAPLTVSNWTNIGKIYRTLISVGKNAEQFALASYREAIKLNQYDPQNYIETGGIFLQLGQFDAAISQFQNAVTLKPDLPNAHYNLGHAYEAKGELEKALQEYETVGKLSQQNKEGVAVIQSEIEKLKEKISMPKSASEELPSGVNVGVEETLPIPGLPGQDNENNEAASGPTPNP